jgi:2',3'-cyclic-nucleotide 2'-phosphodiesterase (5'-nucleotidase family)
MVNMKRTSIWTICLATIALASVTARANAQALGSTSTDLTGAGSRSQETTAGNLAADALKTTSRADAAIVAGDALATATVRKGSISRADLKGLLEDPDDEVAVITLTGAQLRVALERSVSVHPKPFDGFLQVSGITVEFDSGRPPGPRVLKVTINGAALDEKREYRVAAPFTLASGGLGYYRMWSTKDVVRTGRSVLDTLAAYVKEQKTVGPRVEGRLVPR